LAAFPDLADRTVADVVLQALRDLAVGGTAVVVVEPDADRVRRVAGTVRRLERGVLGSA